MPGRNRIQIQQSQRLSLNARLLSSIRVLGFDAAGLNRYLQELAAENPQLVLGPAPDAGWLPRWTGALARLGGGGGGASPAGTRSAEALDLAEAAAPSLIAHAEAFVAGLRLSPREGRIARALIEALEPSGWLARGPAALASGLGVGTAEVEAVLRRLQTIEPRGLFARDLADCLRLQAEEAGWLDGLARAVLDRLVLVARGEIARLAAETGAPEAAVAGVIGRLRGLDPKPGAQFAPCAAPLRQPDLIAVKGPQGWEIALNGSALPSLGLAADTRGDPESDRESDRGGDRARARAVLAMVEGRNATLLRVARAILGRQIAALDEGPGALQPLTMAEIAADLGLHQSTVSRVVAGAAVDTPRGTWWLRALFSQAIRGQGPAAASLREALSRMVAAEDPARPLGDAALAAALAGAGAPVARRTVAKYREMLGIPPAHRRRQRPPR